MVKFCKVMLGVLAASALSLPALAGNTVEFDCEGTDIIAREYFNTFTPDSYPVYGKEVVAEGEVPMITLTQTLMSKEPSGLYTPESRCYTIGERLTNLASALGATNWEEYNTLVAPRIQEGTEFFFIDRPELDKVIMTKPL